MYSFDSISLNQRDISMPNILSEFASAHTDFEKETLLFLNAWLNGTKHFTIQTSGSTGKPKNIVISREQMEQSAKMTIQALALLPNDTSLVCLPTKYIAGKMMMVRALVNNMRIAAVEPSSNPFEKIDGSQKIDFAAFVPLQLQSIMDAGLSNRLNAIKNIIIGGAVINASLRNRIVKELTTNVFATYGMTETITHIALQNIHSDGKKKNFESLPGIQLKLDNRGCLVIEAPHLKEPVITNDLAELTGPHSFKWLGRVDAVINSGGVKIIPEQVEAAVDAALANVNISRRFFVAGLPEERLGEKVVLFIEGSKLLSEEEQGITSLIKEFLLPHSPHAIPKEIRYLPEFIETETGKIRVKDTLKAFEKAG